MATRCHEWGQVSHFNNQAAAKSRSRVARTAGAVGFRLGRRGRMGQSWAVSWRIKVSELLKTGVCGVEKQGGRLDAIVSEGPAVRERGVDFQKKGEAPRKAAFHVGLRNGMAAHIDMPGDPADGK